MPESLRRLVQVARGRSATVNVGVNVAATAWVAAVQLVCIPIYVRLLGIEAYGLIGLSVTLQFLLQALDFGLSPTMNRQMARYSARPDLTAEARDFVRTLEGAYWGVGAIIGGAIIALAPLIASRWVHPAVLSETEVGRAVAMMGIVMALQWPLSLYQGGLLGLQRQATVSITKMAMSTIAGGGAALVLWAVSPTVTAFFGWQIVVAALHAMVITWLMWRALPQSGRAPRFRPELVKDIWRFAAGMSGITLSALLLTQLDKVILSKMLSLEQFGLYTLAAVVASSLAIVISPLFNAIFPRFSRLAALHNGAALRDMYRTSTQAMAVLLLPIAAVLATFSFQVMLLWTGNSGTARDSAALVTLLVIGSAVNGMMHVPYALQLAHGWTQLGLRINTVLVLVTVPTILILTSRAGAVGGAAAWPMLNALYMLVGVPLTHRRLLPGATRDWLLWDVGAPVIAAISVVGLAKLLVPDPTSPPLIALVLCATVVVATVAAGAVTPRIRHWALAALGRTSGQSWQVLPASAPGTTTAAQKQV